MIHYTSGLLVQWGRDVGKRRVDLLSHDSLQTTALRMKEVIFEPLVPQISNALRISTLTPKHSRDNQRNMDERQKHSNFNTRTDV